MSAPATYTYPSNTVLTKLERERSIALDKTEFLGGRFMPITDEDADSVQWEIRDDVKGLTLRRSPDAPFPLIQDSGFKRYLVQPGYYGERVNLDEQRVMRMRKVGTFADPLDVTEEVSRVMAELAYREMMTIEYIRWQLMVLGTVSMADKNGVLQTIATYTPNNVVSGTPWTTTASATPLNDLRVMRDSFVGYGHDFGYRAVACATSKTWNKMLANTNSGDLFGKRGPGQSNILGIKAFNDWIALDENVPTLVAYDGTYKDSNQVPQRFIPDGYVAVVGYNASQGHKMGAYCMTRNASLMGAPGVYAEVGIGIEPPKLPWVARGHNGAPQIDYLKQIVVMKVY